MVNNGNQYQMKGLNRVRTLLSLETQSFADTFLSVRWKKKGFQPSPTIDIFINWIVQLLRFLLSRKLRDLNTPRFTSH